MEQKGNENSATLLYRINLLEGEIQRLQGKLELYVPLRENDLQLQSMRSSLDRIERDVGGMKAEVSEQKKSLDNLLIKILWGTVSIIITVLTALLIGYLTHLIR